MRSPWLDQSGSNSFVTKRSQSFFQEDSSGDVANILCHIPLLEASTGLAMNNMADFAGKASFADSTWRCSAAYWRITTSPEPELELIGTVA